MLTGIRRRLIVSFLLLSILILSTLGGFILWYDYRQNMERVRNHLLNEAITVEQMLPGLLYSRAEPDLDARIKEIGAKINYRITLIDLDGRVIADSLENPGLMENHATRPEVVAALGGSAASEIRYSSTLNANLVYAASPLRINSQIVGVVRLSMPLVEAESGFNQVRSALFAAVLLSILLAWVISARLAKKFTEPLEEITLATKEIADGNLEKRVHVRTGDEIEILGHAINHLASRLEDHVSAITGEKRKLELTLQHMANAVILLDRFGRVTMVNKKAVEIFNIAPEMLGQHNMQVIGNSQLDRLVQLSLEKPASRMADLKTNIKGSKRFLQVFVEPIGNSENDITGILCVFHDITALKEMHEKQSEFIANASHELATPLTSIKGFAETLLDGAMEQPALNEKFIRIIYEEADRMQRLVQDLLQLAKLDSQQYRQQLKCEPTPVLPVINAVIEELRPQWSRKSLTVLTAAASCQISVIATPDWLKHILVNLVENSIKYTPEAGRIVIACGKTDGFGYVAVEDTGIGIPPNELPLIFDRFYRVERARTRSAGGTGLGLAIVKFIVEMLGGKIEAKSAPDRGATFTFYLPLANE
ncbi:MAG: cell wall metabolism sensor histidine kinase WalK [Negativicutes bacterium]|nr:cell wall metabolism sensor histidine kinase WalK [Negativicutes bacterium]